MNSSELIKLLSKHFTVEGFAYEDLKIRGEFSQAALDAEAASEKWKKENPNPGYNSSAYKDWVQMVNQFPSKYAIREQEYLREHEIPEWKEVSQYGGEGQGDTWYSVKYFPSSNIYLKVDGFYSSYEGAEFEDWEKSVKEVFPKQVTITEYN